MLLLLKCCWLLPQCMGIQQIDLNFRLPIMKHRNLRSKFYIHISSSLWCSICTSPNQILCMHSPMPSSPCHIFSTMWYIYGCWHGEILLMHNVILDKPCHWKCHINIPQIVHDQNKNHQMAQPCQGHHMTQLNWKLSHKFTHWSLQLWHRPKSFVWVQIV